MIKYKARGGIFAKIERVEIIRETEKFVVIKGVAGERREAKCSGYESYFDTFDFAKNWIVDSAKSDVEKAEGRLEYAKAQLEKALAISE